MSEKHNKEHSRDEKLDKAIDKTKEEKVKEERTNEEENNQEKNQKEESEILEITSRENEIEELKEKIKDFEERSIRAYAECENIRKRTDKERREILKFANKGLLSSLISFMDDFERALKVGSENEDISKTDFYKGIELIHKRFLSFLNENGVKELECLGEEFNPNIHEALSLVEREDLDKETIVEVYMKGYSLNDEILRTAKVIVGKPNSPNS